MQPMDQILERGNLLILQADFQPYGSSPGGVSVYYEWIFTSASNGNRSVIKSGRWYGRGESFDLVIPNVKEGHSGKYQIKFVNLYGVGKGIEVLSREAVVVVNPIIAALRIVEQPKSVTVTPGSSVTLSVTVVGSSPVTFQWTKDGVSVVGATGPTLTLTNIQLTQGGLYRVNVSSAAGAVVSDPAAVIVRVPSTSPIIIEQPQDQTVTLGGSASFSVKASYSGDDLGGLRLQWQFNGKAIPGATGFGLLLQNVQFSQAGRYTVMVSNSAGSVISRAATLTVTPPASTPAFSAQPQSQTVHEGSTVVLAVSATGSAPFSFQWQWNAVNLAGATTSVLILNKVTLNQAGNYRVVVSNSVGSVTSAVAVLTVLPAGSPLNISGSDSDGDGLTAEFERGVGRYELISGSFTWLEAKVDAEKRGGRLATIISQAEWNSIVAVMGNFFDGLGIWIGATDTINKGSWTWVTGEPWGFTRWSVGGEPRSARDEHYALIIGNGLWNAQSGSVRQGYYLLERGFYTDPNNPDTDGDGFNDGIEYEAGSIPTDSSSRPLPKIIAQPQSVNVIVGSAFTLAVSANGFGSLTYQWRRNGVAINGATSATFSLSNAQHANAGAYDVVLRNASGTTTSAVALVRITPVLEAERLNNGFVAIQLLDSRALGWVVETSADLKTWQRLGAMTYADGLGVFLDATAVGKPQRFYRVASP